MANKNYQRGRRFEWKLKKELEADGYMVFRTAGSHGMFDLIGIKEWDDGPETLLIQCKVTKSDNHKSLVNAFMKEASFKHKFFSQAIAIKTTGEKRHTIYYKLPGVVTDER